PLRSVSIWIFVSVIVPLTIPLGLFSTFRSNSTGPRTPLMPMCTCAMVAGLFMPWNVPLMESFYPSSVAVTVREPVIFDAVELSTGTGLRRARKLVGGGAEDCAKRASAMISSLIALHSSTLEARCCVSGQKSQLVG